MAKRIYSQAIIILLIINSSFAFSQVSGLGDCFKELHRRLSVQATTSGTQSIDSVDEIFSSLLKNNAPVEKLIRVNSHGIVINESTLEKKNHIMRNISSQQWFDQVRKTEQPYYGFTRDSSGNTHLFWVWPAFSSTQQFAGALAAKIDPARVVQYIDESKSQPLKIAVNDKTVYSNNWQSNQYSESVIWNLSDDLIITAYYLSTAAPRAQKNHIENKEDLPVDELRADTVELKQAKSMASSGKKAPKKGFPFKSVLLTLLLGFTIIAIFFKTAKKWQSETKTVGIKAAGGEVVSEETVNEAAESDDPVDEGAASDETVSGEVLNEEHMDEDAVSEEVVDENVTNGDTLDEESVSDETVNEVAAGEEAVSEEVETDDVMDLVDEPVSHGLLEINRENEIHKQHYENNPVDSSENLAIKMDENLSEYDNGSEMGTGDFGEEKSKIRAEIYKEIHGQIIHWVLCESARLSNRVEELTNRINTLEQANGPELETIKQDALCISKEIEIFKRGFCDSL